MAQVSHRRFRESGRLSRSRILPFTILFLISSNSDSRRTYREILAAAIGNFSGNGVKFRLLIDAAAEYQFGVG